MYCIYICILPIHNTNLFSKWAKLAFLQCVVMKASLSLVPFILDEYMGKNCGSPPKEIVLNCGEKLRKLRKIGEIAGENCGPQFPPVGHCQSHPPGGGT